MKPRSGRRPVLEIKRPRPSTRGNAQLPVNLLELARLHGIQSSYKDVTGQERFASPEGLRGILQGLGVPAGKDREIRESLQASKAAARREPLQPVYVAWGGRARSLDLQLTAGDMRQVHSRLLLEDGRIKSLLPPGSGNSQISKRLDVPAVPLGYHTLELEIEGRLFRALWIAAPVRAYEPPQTRHEWGFFLPVYACHSNQSWGAGDLEDWRQFAKWAGQQGAGVTGTLPLLAGFIAEPFGDPSPYAPASRLFWNEFYIHVPGAPGFQASRSASRRFHSRPFQDRLARFRQEAHIDYAAQLQAKREILQILSAEAWRGELRPQLAAFAAQNPRARDYAQFRAACESTGASWQQWIPRMQQGKLQPEDYRPESADYHLYVQWLMEAQMQALLETGRDSGVRQYLDLPLGVHASGYDTWRERDSFALQVSAGAPPDSFFTRGQDWGFPPLHPERIRQRHYSYFIEYVRFQMRHTGMLRIDHVMGLHRLYWVPRGAAPTEGAYVTYPAEELYAILCLESSRHKTVLVGENLGTVPPETNAAMAKRGLRAMYVLQYEQRPGSHPLPLPAAASVASLNTHDMPTFAAHFQGLDLQDRRDLGLVTPAEFPRLRAQRQELSHRLAAFLAARKLLEGSTSDPARVAMACLKWLALSRAEILLINLEDLWSEEKPQNVPGTHTERPNWRRKARLSLEHLRDCEGIQVWLRHLQALRTMASQHRLRSPARKRSRLP